MNYVVVSKSIQPFKAAVKEPWLFYSDFIKILLNLTKQNRLNFLGLNI